MNNKKGQESFELTKTRKIQIEGMNEAYFFQNVLNCIMENGYLSESVIQDLQLQLINLLTEQIEAFNKGMSSSIPESTARKLMDFIYYTIGFKFERLEDLDESITLLEHQPIKELFEEGKKLIAESFESLKQQYSLLQSQLLPTQNIAYRETYDKGLAPFFKQYNMDFETRECPASIDYPLSNDRMEQVGIDCMISYIQKSLWEHSLCLKFNFDEVEAVLKGYHEGYKHLPINIFELVLMTAIGRLIAEKDLTSLQLEEEDLDQIEEALEILPSEVLRKKILGYGAQCLAQLGLEEQGMMSYTEQTLIKFVTRIEEALEDGTIDKIFIAAHPSQEGIIHYKGGKKLDNDRFNAVTEEIRTAQGIVDKIKWVKEEVQDAEDLKDVLEADCFFDEEYLAVYDSLQDMELALLINLTRVDEYGILLVDENLDQETEKEWQKHLRLYLKELPQERRQRVIELSERIKRD